MLTKLDFDVLRQCTQKECNDQNHRIISEGGDSDSVRQVLLRLERRGLVKDGQITEKGQDALTPYKVDNAIILAAGAATRLAPLSFERPKAMFEVRGEILIERLIRQLNEAGIFDIMVVVGHMKEAFFYLEDKFGVKIAVNQEYARRNNHSSLWRVKEFLGNTYVVSSDQYYTDNIFSLYNYGAYCSVCFSQGPTDEEVVSINSEGVIVDIKKGGSSAYYMQGPAYFDRDFSSQYIKVLSSVYDRPETLDKLWEQVFAEHIDNFRVSARIFSSGAIHEFDYLTDLVEFDSDFFANVDSGILDNICSTLSCVRAEIVDVEPIKAGLTNLSTLFSVNGQKYIYRYPGDGTDEVVNREAEACALRIARDLGLDDTLVYADDKEGWKISRYIEEATELDYSNMCQVQEALHMARVLHTSGKVSPWSFDFYKEGERIACLLQSLDYPLPREFGSFSCRVAKVSEAMAPELDERVLCHNDFYAPNFLVTADRMRLIDWEYAAMGDPACDIGNFVAQGSGYSIGKTLEILPLYYGRPATDVEERHCLGAVGVVGWYWYVWAMYKEATGNSVGEWLYIWYRAAKEYIAEAEIRYGLCPPSSKGMDA